MSYSTYTNGVYTVKYSSPVNSKSIWVSYDGEHHELFPVKFYPDPEPLKSVENNSCGRIGNGGNKCEMTRRQHRAIGGSATHGTRVEGSTREMSDRSSVVSV